MYLNKSETEQYTHQEVTYSENKKIVFNFSGVSKIDNATLARLSNVVLKHGCNGVEIHGASRSIIRAIKVLNLDKYVIFKNKKPWFCF